MARGLAGEKAAARTGQDIGEGGALGLGGRGAGRGLCLGEVPGHEAEMVSQCTKRPSLDPADPPPELPG